MTVAPGRRWLRSLLVLAVSLSAVITAWAEWPSTPMTERVGPPGIAPTVRLVVHAGRSDFAWQMATAVALGLADGGVASTLATTTHADATPQPGDEAVVLVAPTYWWAPAWTIGRWTAAHRLPREVPLVPVVTAAGQGERALALLRARAIRSGATVVDGLALYTMRPNDAAAEAGGDNLASAVRVARARGRALAASLHRAP